MRLALERQEPVGAFGCRSVTEADAAPLGRLMLDAYRGTVDDEGETLEDAVAEVAKTTQGGYGRFLPDCSLAIEQNGVMSSACLITLIEERGLPFLAFAMTAPGSQGKGMAAFLLKTAINVLFDNGHRELVLVVTEANEPAVRLYRKLGFEPVAD